MERGLLHPSAILRESRSTLHILEGSAVCLSNSPWTIENMHRERSLTKRNWNCPGASWFYLFIVWLVDWDRKQGCGCMCHSEHLEVRTSLRSQFSPSTMWPPGVQLSHQVCAQAPLLTEAFCKSQRQVLKKRKRNVAFVCGATEHGFQSWTLNNPRTSK